MGCEDSPSPLNDRIVPAKVMYKNLDRFKLLCHWEGELLGLQELFLLQLLPVGTVVILDVSVKKLKIAGGGLFH